METVLNRHLQGRHSDCKQLKAEHLHAQSLRTPYESPSRITCKVRTTVGRRVENALLSPQVCDAYAALSVWDTQMEMKGRQDLTHTQTRRRVLNSEEHCQVCWDTRVI